MQPSSREMQGLNSLLNSSSSQISLQDLHNSNQIQNSHMNNQLPQQLAHFDPISHDDFLEQMLSSYSWPDLNPNNNSLHDIKPPDETTPSNNHNTDNHTNNNNNNNNNNVAAFSSFNEQSSLASKFRNHQISANAPKNAAVSALMLQHQLLMSRDSGLLNMLQGNDVVDASSFKSPNPGVEASVQALYNGFTGSTLHGAGQSSNQTQHFQHPQGNSNPMQEQNFGTASGAGGATNQAATGGAAGGAPAQPRQRVRARRGQATDPHSIAERLRRERIAERMKALQELVPNANKTDKASMLDEIIDYVKFLQLQVKVLSMSRLGSAAAVAPLVVDMSSEGGGDCIQANGHSNGGGAHAQNHKTTATTTSNDSLTMTEHQVAKLMEEDMGSAMQYLQGKGLCLMPISLATAISTATCHTRNVNPAATQIPTAAAEGPSSPSMSVLTVQSTVAGHDGIAVSAGVKDAASVSKP